MDRKPTYEELEQRVRALEQEVVEGKQAEEALRESEEKYRSLVELSPDMVLIHSKEGTIEFLNNAGTRLFGAHNTSDIIGRSGFDFIHPDYREIVGKRIQKGFEENKPLPINEELFVRVDGTSIDVEVSGVPLFIGTNLLT